MTDGQEQGITERLRTLAGHRAVLAALVDERKAREALFAKANEGLTVSLLEAKARIEQEEAAVRAMGLQLYHADPMNKKPVAGIQIKVMKGLDFDGTKALAWAREKQVALDVSLNEKAFVAIAATFSDEEKSALGVVETATATVQIDKDLDKALGTSAAVSA